MVRTGALQNTSYELETLTAKYFFFGDVGVMFFCSRRGNHLPEIYQIAYHQKKHADELWVVVVSLTLYAKWRNG